MKCSEHKKIELYRFHKKKRRDDHADIEKQLIYNQIYKGRSDDRGYYPRNQKLRDNGEEPGCLFSKQCYQFFVVPGPRTTLCVPHHSLHLTIVQLPVGSYYYLVQ